MRWATVALLLVLAALAPAEELPRCHDGKACLELCKHGDKLACVLARQLFKAKHDAAGELDALHAGAELLEKGCAAGVPHVKDCLDAARMRQDANEPDRARADHQRGCDLGSSAACRELLDGAQAAEKAVLGKRILEVDQKGCDAGVVESCRAMAYDLEIGVPPYKRDATRAAAMHARADGIEEAACDKGDRAACSSLAFVLELRDPARAGKIYLKLCLLERQDAGALTDPFSCDKAAKAGVEVPPPDAPPPPPPPPPPPRHR